jgi:hypothetical protein
MNLVPIKVRCFLTVIVFFLLELGNINLYEITIFLLFKVYF